MSTLDAIRERADRFEGLLQLLSSIPFPPDEEETALARLVREDVPRLVAVAEAADLIHAHGPDKPMRMPDTCPLCAALAELGVSDPPSYQALVSAADPSVLAEGEDTLEGGEGR